MNFFKRIFYSKQYKALLNANYAKFSEFLEIEKKKQNEKDREREMNHNSACPNCGKNIIVNKIRRVEGRVSGSFSLGSGYVSGSTDTNEVNHCSSCGNEWKKYNYRYCSQENIAEDICRELIYFGENATEEIPTSYQHWIKDLQPFYAETIYLTIANSGYYQNISLNWLRCYFRSIYKDINP